LRDWRHKRALQAQELADRRAAIQEGLDSDYALYYRFTDTEVIIERVVHGACLRQRSAMPAGVKPSDILTDRRQERPESWRAASGGTAVAFRPSRAQEAKGKTRPHQNSEGRSARQVVYFRQR